MKITRLFGVSAFAACLLATSYGYQSPEVALVLGWSNDPFSGDVGHIYRYDTYSGQYLGSFGTINDSDASGFGYQGSLVVSGPDRVSTVQQLRNGILQINTFDISTGMETGTSSITGYSHTWNGGVTSDGAGGLFVSGSDSITSQVISHITGSTTTDVFTESESTSTDNLYNRLDYSPVNQRFVLGGVDDISQNYGWYVFNSSGTVEDFDNQTIDTPIAAFNSEGDVYSIQKSTVKYTLTDDGVYQSSAQLNVDSTLALGHNDRMMFMTDDGGGNKGMALFNTTSNFGAPTYLGGFLTPQLNGLLVTNIAVYAAPEPSMVFIAVLGLGCLLIRRKS